VKRLPVIVLLLLALLGAQSASTVCSAQCMEMASGHASAMSHCSAMPPAGSSFESCPAHLCTIDLATENPGKVLQLQTAVFAFAWFATPVSRPHVAASVPLRSSEGDPPLITPIRV
jgi:hypothetical protein